MLYVYSKLRPISKKIALDEARQSSLRNWNSKEKGQLTVIRRRWWIQRRWQQLRFFTGCLLLSSSQCFQLPACTSVSLLERTILQELHRQISSGRSCSRLLVFPCLDNNDTVLNSSCYISKRRWWSTDGTSRSGCGLAMAWADWWWRLCFLPSFFSFTLPRSFHCQEPQPPSACFISPLFRFRPLSLFLLAAISVFFPLCFLLAKGLRRHPLCF